jgi:hypothetical protein
MDLKTGKIHHLTDEEYSKIPEEQAKYLLKLLGPPKKNCRKCFGRGHIGKGQDDLYVPCTCVLKNQKRK